jgi:hypothetical protein
MQRHDRDCFAWVQFGRSPEDGGVTLVQTWWKVVETHELKLQAPTRDHVISFTVPRHDVGQSSQHCPYDNAIHPLNDHESRVHSRIPSR